VSRWERFCVVGVGGHARTKLIPAIEANGQHLVGMVSRQAPETLPPAPVYATLAEALTTLPRDTAIIISSPPGLHHAQASLSIEAGFDVIVEKPAFLTAAEVRDIAARCKVKGTILVEAFMQRHTGLYRRFLDFWTDHRDRVEALDLAFVLPSMPPSTFRNESDPGSSSVYDIGCYVLAMLDDIGLPLGALDIAQVIAAGTMEEAVILEGTLDGVRVSARIGVGAEYLNVVTTRLQGGRETAFRPFFYGRAGEKTIASATREEKLEDANAFEAMLATSPAQWRATQPERLAAVEAVTARLETLAAQLARFRIVAA
jgi:predicted dehydrogenase